MNRVEKMKSGGAASGCSAQINSGLALCSAVSRNHRASLKKYALLIAFLALTVSLLYSSFIATSPVTAYAADGDVEYKELSQSDFDAAGGQIDLASGSYVWCDHFRLADNVTGSLKFDAPSTIKEITIDLNGHTITNKTGSKSVIQISKANYNDNIVVNIKNGTVKQEVQNNAAILEDYAATATSSNSSAVGINLDKVNVISNASGSSCIKIAWAALRIAGGTFDSTGSGKSAIESEDIAVDHYSDFPTVITGGDFKSDEGIESIATEKGTSVSLKGGTYSLLPSTVKLAQNYAFRYVSSADSPYYQVESTDEAEQNTSLKVAIPDLVGTYASKGKMTKEAGYAYFFDPDDATAYAKAHNYNTERCAYMVNFSVDDKPKWKQLLVSPNDSVSQPVDPSKEGWAFGTWQLNGADYDFSKNVTSDITLTANWVEGVAEVDGTQYSSLQKAVDKVSGDSGSKTITLLKDTNENIVVGAASAPDLAIDLGRNTLQSTGNIATTIKVLNGKVLLKNGNVVHSSNYNSAIWVGEEDSTNNPSLTLQGLKVTASQQRCVVQNCGKLIIESGEYISNSSNICAHLKSGEATISGGSFSSLKQSIYVEGATATINSGTFNKRVEKKSGSAVINGGEFSSHESAQLVASDKVMFRPTGSSSFNVVDKSTAAAEAEAWVAFTASGNEYSLIFQSADEAKTYAEEHNLSVREFEAESNGNKYPTIEEALEANTGIGSIFVLCDLDKSLTLDKTTTLDLKGHTLSCSTEGTSPVNIEGVSASITNGTVSATGAPAVAMDSGNVTINASLASTSGEAISMKDGILCITGGEINGTVSVLEGGSGSFSISGGSFESASYLDKLNNGKKMIKRADSEGAAGRYEVVDEADAISGSNAVVEVTIGSKACKLYFESASEADAYASEHEGAAAKTFVTANVTIAENLVYDGVAKPATVTLSGAAEGDSVQADFEYNSSSGVVEEPINAGNYKVTVTGLSGTDASKYELRSKPAVPFTITPASIAEAVVTPESGTWTYDESEKKPGVASVQLNGKTLTSDDYEVSGYESNTDAGTAYVKVSGKGNYTGEAKGSFTINALSIKDAKVTLGASLTYNGSEQTQEVESVVVTSGGKEITVPLDSLEITGNKATDAGTYTMTLTASDSSNFTGSVKQTFKVAKANPVITITDPGKKTFGDADFKLEVTTNSDGKFYYESGNSSVAKISDDGLVTIRSKGESELQVGVAATKNYSPGIETVMLEVDPASIANAVVVPESGTWIYDETEKKPGVASVQLNGKTLTSDDYEVSGYESNTDAGTAYVKVSGKGNYTGEAKGSFTINALSIKDAKVTLGASLTYNGSEQTQEVESVVVTSGGKEITVPLDSLEITGNKATGAGTYTMTLAAKKDSNFADSATKRYSIAQNSGFAAAKVTLSKTSFTYNGKAQKPSVKSVVLNGKTLKAGTDYTASVASGKKVGTYNVTIAAKGSYTGKATASFVVNPKGVTKFKVSKAKKAFKAKWKKNKTERSGVQVKYSTKKSMKNAKTVKAKGASAKAKKVKKLKKKTKYYVQVRAYKTVGGKTYYSSWSAKKAVKTK